MKKVTKANLQPPFRQKDLVRVSSFIGQCHKYDIRTTNHELEYFEKEGLLLPAVKINRGVVKYKRVLGIFDDKGQTEWRFIPLEHMSRAKKEYKIKEVDKPIIYGHGSILKGSDDWLDWYMDNKLVTFPAKTKFKEWSKLKSSQTWATSPKKLGYDYETYYASYQMYPLQFIQNRRSITIKNAGLFKSDDEWVNAGQTLKEMYTKDVSNDFIKQKIIDYYKLFGFMNDLEELWEYRQKDLSKFYKKAVKGYGGNRKDAMDDLRHHEETFDKELSPKAKRLLAKHKVSVDYLENWRITFLGFGTFGLRIKVMTLRNPYLKTIEEETLANTEHPYKIVYLINWFIKLVGGKETTIKELILGFAGKYCPYCQTPFEPIRKTQVSCGSASCKRAHENEIKRQKRKAGIYKS